MKSRLRAKAARRASLSVGGDTQDAQRAAVALQKDYLALVQGHKLMLWPSQVEADARDQNTGVEVPAIEEAKPYYTANGTVVKWLGMVVVLNDSIKSPYEEVVKACAMREIVLEEEGEGEHEDDTGEQTLSLEERMPYAGMQLQETAGAVYVRDCYPGGAAEGAGVKVGSKLVAVKGMPFRTLYDLSEIYGKFGVKVGDQIAFTFDRSADASLWNAVADGSDGDGSSKGSRSSSST